MGTNYYWREHPCPTCGRDDEELHIGKSSGGWCFSLHVHPAIGINGLPDWQERWSREGSEIRNEYGDKLTPGEMLDVVTKRSCPERGPVPALWYEQNHGEPGPNGLARHRISPGHCIGHGAGTWDLLVSDFS